MSSSTTDIIDKTQRRIFVFGSNTGGVHGAGAALYAKQHHGAIIGKGHGHWGWSYAIPTRHICSGRVITLDLRVIESYVDTFIDYAIQHPEWVFSVTRIGCGRAGYTDTQISPLFDGSPMNIVLPHEWLICPCCGGSVNLERDKGFKEAAGIQLKNSWKKDSTPA